MSCAALGCMKRLLVASVLLLVSTFAIAAVNINTATKDQLDALPGIGPVKGQAIIDYRTANGASHSLRSPTFGGTRNRSWLNVNGQG